MSCLFQNVFFDRVLAHQTINVDVTRLPNAVATVLRLFVHCRVPITVIKNDGVSSRQVDAETTGFGANEARTHIEHMLISETFFGGVDDALLRQGFGDLLRRPDLPSRIHREIEECLLYFGKAGAEFVRPLKLMGYRKLYALLGRPEARAVLERDYGIDDLFFQNMGSIGTMLLPSAKVGGS